MDFFVGNLATRCVGVDVRCHSVAGGEEFMGDVQSSISQAQSLQADAMRLQSSMQGTLQAFFKSAFYMYKLGVAPLRVTVANEGLKGSPTKHVVILVVTANGRGPHPT